MLPTGRDTIAKLQRQLQSAEESIQAERVNAQAAAERASAAEAESARARGQVLSNAKQAAMSQSVEQQLESLKVGATHPFDTGGLPLSYSGNPGVNVESYRGA